VEHCVQSDFRISVTKDYLVFSSAHFITFKGHQCETLHGHNYRVGVQAEGTIDGECLFVVDFSIIKKMVRGLVDRIDHKVILPTKNTKLKIVEQGEKIRVDYYGEPTYLFPTADCALLPVENTTAEMLAKYLAGELRCELAKAGVTNLTSLELEVEENFGQSATFRVPL
jgi:6-pyruvoyltetrahydropterin/6-carboxytetrahydropterin synthase